MKRLESIQHLRGIAAMLVVFVHFPTPLAQFCGSIGVDIFFFISGFIIFTSISRSGYYNRPAVFLKKRLLRILPLYWLTIAAYILMHLVLDKIRHSNLSPSFDYISVIKSFFFIPIKKAGVYTDPVVFLGWSLNFEMLFYLLSFLFLFLFRKNFFLPLFLLLSGLGLSRYITGNFHNVIPAFLTSPFLLYFSVGLLFGRFQDEISKKIEPVVEILFFLSFYILFVVMLGKDFGYEFSGMPREKIVCNGLMYPRILIWGIPSLVLLISYFSLARKYHISNFFLNKLGDSSYSIYLLQVFFFSFFYEIAFKLNDISKIIVSFILIGILVWVSGLSYKYFEKRVHQ